MAVVSSFWKQTWCFWHGNFKWYSMLQQC